MIDRRQNPNFVQGIFLLSVWKISDFDFLQGVYLAVC
jgi:hypothetical protein